LINVKLKNGKRGKKQSGLGEVHEGGKGPNWTVVPSEKKKKKQKKKKKKENFAPLKLYFFIILRHANDFSSRNYLHVHEGTIILIIISPYF
jgi:hypothetical protein